MQVAIRRTIGIGCAAVVAVASLPHASRAQNVPPAQESALLDSALAVPGLRIEYRWVQPTTVPPRDRGQAYRDPISGGTVTLAKDAAFDLSVAVGVLARNGPGGVSVMLRLSVAGADSLLKVTTGHQQQDIGVVINGRLVSIATVATPLGGPLPVMTDLVPAQARVLMDRIRSAIPHAEDRPPT